jgi:hypothetical protein
MEQSLGPLGCDKNGAVIPYPMEQWASDIGLQAYRLARRSRKLHDQVMTQRTRAYWTGYRELPYRKLILILLAIQCVKGRSQDWISFMGMILCARRSGRAEESAWPPTIERQSRHNCRLSSNKRVGQSIQETAIRPRFSEFLGSCPWPG